MIGFALSAQRGIRESRKINVVHDRGQLQVGEVSISVNRRGAYGIGDFLDPSDAALREQWRSVLARQPVLRGQRQVNFVPSEVVLSLCASLLVDHSRFGSSSAHRAGFPVQHLARLYKRPPSSILAKMANLDGSRSHGGRHELEVSARMTSDSALLQDVYLRILRAARAEGIGRDALPDFLELEDGGSLWLVGQEELVESEVERELEGIAEKWARERQDVPVEITQRLLTSTVRIGQHRFAKAVLTNHGNRCVFCGMGSEIGGRRRPRLLTASHIKPWRDSTNKERLDHLNGLTACPTHDVAFDTGLLTVSEDLSIAYATDLERALPRDEPLRRAFGKPPLADRLILPASADRPDTAYLGWHRTQVFVSPPTAA
ncbi:HNH endonuclease [Rhodococcus ruber]|uniref:HNH endonuclease n=1 Tax=Rhodococcus ruber TaxID=1830 RepID=UPI001F223EF0|nr:HNH endonuclease [Rhodococcus ruber]